MNKFQVVVGNLGTVYDGNDEKEACDTYDDYVSQSKNNYGRAGNEDVTLFEDGEPSDEHYGDCEERLDNLNCFCCMLEGKHGDDVKKAVALAPQVHEGVTENEDQDMVSWQFKPICEEHKESWIVKATCLMYPNHPPMIALKDIDIPSSTRT